MGVKGSKRQPACDDERDAVLGELSSLGDISARAMFGGCGLFASKKMFGLITSEGRLHFKADDATVAPFEEAGSTRHGRMPYWSVPPDVRQDAKKLRAWAKRSIAVALSK